MEKEPSYDEYEKEPMTSANSEDNVTSEEDVEIKNIPEEGGDGNATPSSSSTFQNKWFQMAIVLIMVVVIVITISFVASNDNDNDNPVVPPVTIDYRTGVSLITYYEVNSHISTRLVRTVLKMEIANALDCASIHGVTLQIPQGSRISSLHTVTDADCKTNGQVLAIDDARETFLDAATKTNLPGAYVEQQDSFTYSLQVSIPPLGTSSVELVVEGLLSQRLGDVEFQIPILPNEQVDQIVFNLTIDDVGTATNPTTTPTYFELDIPNKYQNEYPGTEDEDDNDEENINGNEGVVDNSSINTTRTITYDNSTDQFIITEDDDDDDDVANNVVHATDYFYMNLPDAREHEELPLVLNGRYMPASIPDDGIVYMDDSHGCFEHYFSPTSLQAMPRNILFLVDVSHSMSYDGKLDGAKVALKTFIETLTPNDNFMIQTFASRGTESLWGMAEGTEDEKADAMEFIDELYTLGYDSTDLHEAFLEGLLRFQRQTIKERMDESVSIMLTITDGYANNGETDRGTIAEDIYKRNREGDVKIYNLGFQFLSDMELLDTIAVMNGGVAKTLYVSTDNDGYKEQIEFFMQSEFGSVLLSDVEVNLDGGTMYAETQANFALLADGYEIVVRGLFDQEEGNDEMSVITQAATSDGRAQWRAYPESSPYTIIEQESITSLCYQSYAHDRITHLLRLRDAASLVDDEYVSDLVTLTKPCEQPKDLATCMEEEAVALALNASLVTKGLTAMVTIDDANCVPLDGNETEICEDGTSDSEWPEGPRSAPRPARDGASAVSRGGAATYAESEGDYGYGYSDDGYGSGSTSYSSCAWKILLYTLSFILVYHVYESGKLS